MTEYYQWFKTPEDVENALNAFGERQRLQELFRNYQENWLDRNPFRFHPEGGNDIFNFINTPLGEGVLCPLESVNSFEAGFFHGTGFFSWINFAPFGFSWVSPNCLWRSFEVLPFNGERVTWEDFTLREEANFWTLLETIRPEVDKIYFNPNSFPLLILFDLQRGQSRFWILPDMDYWSNRAKIWLSLLSSGRVPDMKDFAECFHPSELESLQVEIDGILESS